MCWLFEGRCRRECVGCSRGGVGRECVGCSRGGVGENVVVYDENVMVVGVVKDFIRGVLRECATWESESESE